MVVNNTVYSAVPLRTTLYCYLFLANTFKLLRICISANVFHLKIEWYEKGNSSGDEEKRNFYISSDAFFIYYCSNIFFFSVMYWVRRILKMHDR